MLGCPRKPLHESLRNLARVVVDVLEGLPEGAFLL